MPFTGVVGSPDSRPGNTVPGLGGASSALVETASNTLALTQVVNVNITYNRGVSQSLTLGQHSGQVFDATASNTLTLTTVADNDLIGNTELSQTLTLIQSVTHTMSRPLSASNFLIIGSSAQRTNQFNREVDHTLTLTQSAVKTIPEALSQDLVLTQLCDVVKVVSRGVVQSITLSHTVAVAVTYSRTVSQGLVLTHSAVKTISRVLSAHNTLTMSQTAVGIGTRGAHNTLTFTQTADVLMVKRAVNTLELTQSVRGNFTTRKRLFDVLPIFHRVALSTTLRRPITSTLTLTHSAVAEVTRATSSHLNLSHSVEVDKLVPAFDTLELAHGVQLNYSLAQPAETFLFLSHQVDHTKSRGFSVGQVLAFESHARATRVLHASASNTLNLSQEMYKERFPEVLNQPLALVQDAIGQKVAPRAASHTLHLTQSVSVSKTLLRSINHQLIFLNSFNKYIGLPGMSIVTVPTVQVTRVTRLVILESGQFVITLPPPEFNDKEGGNGTISLKRSMDGSRRVYKRTQPSSRLVYDFIMDRVKAIELRTFILNCNSSVIRMTNWKGEIWIVILTNNPFTFTEDAYWNSPWGNKCSVTLEFQGVRIN